MKIIIILMLVFACMQQRSFAQADTTYVYLGYDGVTTKDSANTYIKFYKEGDVWYGKEYYLPTGILKSEGHYKEPNYLTAIRTFKNYSRKGTLVNITVMNDSSHLLERTYYHRNGRKQVFMKFHRDRPLEKTCWDSSGVETTSCRVESEAQFAGGPEGWRKFLERNLNANVAADAGAPEGLYTVTAQFLVGKDGTLSHIKAVDVPSLCKPCGVEVVRILSTTPNWEPAIVDGEPDVYQAIQKVSFQIIEDKPRRKRRN
jgi:hypothetical protein